MNRARALQARYPGSCAAAGRITSATTGFMSERMPKTPESLVERVVTDLFEQRPLQRHELILCRFCHAPVTSLHEEQVISGGHSHYFINPYGTAYVVGCFRQAPGCDIRGTATRNHSWFPGFAWQLASCTDCGEHLGWFYENSEREQFFGLIVDKLARYQG